MRAARGGIFLFRRWRINPARSGGDVDRGSRLDSARHGHEPARHASPQKKKAHTVSMGSVSAASRRLYGEGAWATSECVGCGIRAPVPGAGSAGVLGRVSSPNPPAAARPRPHTGNARPRRQTAWKRRRLNPLRPCVIFVARRGVPVCAHAGQNRVSIRDRRPHQSAPGLFASDVTKKSCRAPHACPGTGTCSGAPRECMVGAREHLGARASVPVRPGKHAKDHSERRRAVPPGWLRKSRSKWRYEFGASFGPRGRRTKPPRVGRHHPGLSTRSGPRGRTPPTRPYRPDGPHPTAAAFVVES